MLATRRSPQIADGLARAMRASAQQAQLGNAGALCVVDLRMVALRAQQWAELLPRVKPHYGRCPAMLSWMSLRFFCV